jgi:hypothetical protein
MYRAFFLIAALTLTVSTAYTQTASDAARSPEAIEITVFKSPL